MWDKNAEDEYDVDGNMIPWQVTKNEDLAKELKWKKKGAQEDPLNHWMSIPFVVVGCRDHTNLIKTVTLELGDLPQKREYLLVAI